MTSETVDAKQSVLITGGSRGLGRHFVEAFASGGYDVFFTYVSSEDEARNVESSVAETGGRATGFAVDVTDANAVGQLVRKLDDEGSGIGVLINNAGVSLDGMSWKLPIGSWEESIDVNLTGAFRMIQAVLPGMRARKGGRIVNISSVVGRRGVAGTAAYSASKAALTGLTRTVAREVARNGVTVNALVLGYFDTGMGTRLPAAVRQQISETIPLGRFGDPDKLASFLVFLCSDACDYLTGQEIVFDGGFLA